jgi:Laminin G domain
MAQHNSAHVTEGVLTNCQMKCDSEPCKNGGICTEKFSTQESTCNCEHTSFLGEFCMEEKGADFSGESILQRKFIPSGPVEEVKLQLAFSTNDLRRTERVMFLLQTEQEKQYYMMVGITTDGHLQFEEDREGATFGATLERNFLNHARHSVYYKRHGSDATLLIDREVVALEPVATRPHIYRTQTTDYGAHEVQIGGINSTDPRFAIYKSYSGCLSSKEVCLKSFSKG